MSASATTRAPPVSTRFVASSVPRPPQPSRPTRTAELAAVPRTSDGLINIAPAVAAATPINLRRSILSGEFGCCCFASFDIHPPDTRYILEIFLVSSCAVFTALRKKILLRRTACRELSDQFFQISLRSPHIFHLLRPVNLPFDGDRTAIIQLLQSRDNARKIHFPLADRHFFPQLLGVCRPQPVLGVNPLHVGAEKLDRVDRIRFAVKDQIGEVEVDALIVHSDVLNRPHQGDGSFLAGLVTEILAIALAIRGHFAHRLHRFSVYLVIGVLGYESTVCLDGRNPTLLGKVRCLLDMRNAGCPRLPWDQTYRQRPLVEVPHFFSRSAHDQRSSLNSVLVKRPAQ